MVLPPPPIQGVGNAAGATMQVQLRDGSFDLAKLQNVVQAMVDERVNPVEPASRDRALSCDGSAVHRRGRPGEDPDRWD